MQKALGADLLLEPLVAGGQLFDHGKVVRVGLVVHDPAAGDDLDLAGAQQAAQLVPVAFRVRAPPQVQVRDLGPDEAPALVLGHLAHHVVQDAARLLGVVLLERLDPARIVVRVRHHKHLAIESSVRLCVGLSIQVALLLLFLENLELPGRRVAAGLVLHVPALFPGAAVGIVELELAVHVEHLDVGLGRRLLRELAVASVGKHLQFVPGPPGCFTTTTTKNGQLLRGMTSHWGA